jgi:N-methylhydantoinase B
MRAGIADLPDGRYAFADVLDDDGMGRTDIPIRVAIVVAGEEIWFDFAGSAPQVRGNMNNSFAGLQAAVLFALKVLIDPEGPTNHGMLDPVHITAPAASVVNAAFPAATAARAQTCQRIVDVVLGALAAAVPERVIAASNGANGVAAFSGRGPGGRYYLYMETIGGGAGARSYKDGTDGVQVHITNTSNLPIEALESEYPLLIERYELIEDSGGAGRWRGGMGLRRVYRGLGHTVTFSGQGERAVHSPWGLFGGSPGGRGRIQVVHDDGRREALAIKPASLEVPPTAVVWIETPGAGGYGPPELRGREKLDEDHRSGKFSPRYLRVHYGYRPDGAGPRRARKSAHRRRRAPAAARAPRGARRPAR